MALKIESLADLEAFLNENDIEITERFSFKDMNAALVVCAALFFGVLCLPPQGKVMDVEIWITNELDLPAILRLYFTSNRKLTMARPTMELMHLTVPTRCSQQ